MIVLRIATALTRMWVRVYTAGVMTEAAHTRRLEIDSDLWEHVHDARERDTAPVLTAADIILRALIGVPHDLIWRAETNRLLPAHHNRRLAFMAFSPNQIRWMGLAGILGGLVWAGTFVMPLDVGDIVRGYGHIAISILLVAGLLAFYAHERERLNRVGRIGFAALLTSFTAWVVLNVLATVFNVSDSAMVMGVVALTWVFLLPPGFLLLGIGTRGAARVAPLILGCLFTASLVIPRSLYAHYFASDTDWKRGDTPVGLTLMFLMGLGVALMGYIAVRSGRAENEMRSRE